MSEDTGAECRDYCGHHNLTGVVGTSSAVCDDCGAALTTLTFVDDPPIGGPTGLINDGTITYNVQVHIFEKPSRMGMR